MKSYEMTEYDEKNKTLIKTTTRDIIYKDTGEMATVDEIKKIQYGSKAFWKCYLMDFLSVLGIVYNKQLDIFIYIAENTNQANNIFLGTYKKIAKDVGASEPTIAKIIKKLIKNNFVKRIQSGALLVNPNILMKGNENKRQILLTYYRTDEPINEISVSRTKAKILKIEAEETEKQPEIVQTSILDIKGVGEDDQSDKK